MRVLICALCPPTQRHSAIVAEAADGPRGEAHLIDFFESDYDACDRLGLLPELERTHYPIARFVFGDEGFLPRRSR